MHPILISFGGHELHSYGVIVALGVVIGFLFADYLTDLNRIDKKRFFPVLTISLFMGIIGAKVVGALLAEHPASWFSVDDVSFLGVPLGAVPTFIFTARMVGLPLGRAGDVAMLALTLAQSIGRIGCFLAGCCYGTPTNLPIGMHFESRLVPEVLHAVPLHPVQLYSAVLEFILFLFLLKLFRRTPDQHARHGQIIIWYGIGYGFLRVVEEFFRADTIRSGLWGISLYQWIAALFAVSSILVLKYVRSQEFNRRG